MNERNIFIFIVAGTLFLVGFLVVLFATAEGATYYVKNAGNNGNSGTSIEQAWQYIGYGLLQLSAGDTLFINAETYTGYNSNQNLSNVATYVESTGTVGNPIVIKGYGGIPVIDGEHGQYKGWTTWGMKIRSGKDYVVFDSLMTKAHGDSSGPDNEASGFYADTGCNGVAFKNCIACSINSGGQTEEPAGTGIGSGFMLKEVQQCSVLNCTAYRVYCWVDGDTWSGQAGGVTFTMNWKKPCSHNVIDGGEYYECANGIFFKKNTSDSNTISNNYIHDCRQGIVPCGDANIWEFNVIVDCDTLSIYPNVSYPNVTSERDTFRQNTIVGSNYALWIIHNRAGTNNHDEMVVYNNLFINHRGGQPILRLREETWTPDSLWIDYNCYYDSTRTEGDSCGQDITTYYSFTGWQTFLDGLAWCGGEDAHSVYADPVFEDEANRDFNLTQNSPEAVKTGGLGGTYMGAHEPPEAGGDVPVKRFGRSSLGRGSY